MFRFPLPAVEQLESRVLFSSPSPAASVAGLWSGSRSERGLSSTFATVLINLNLTQSGNKVSGTEVRRSPRDPEYFADLITGGTVSGNAFNLQDQSITAEKTPSDYRFVLYSAALTLSADGQTMSGLFSGSGHVHGTMTLLRVALAKITLNTAALGPVSGGGGIVLHYAIGTLNVTHSLRFDVYRSSTPHLNSTSELIGSQTVSRTRKSMLSVGSHRVMLLAGSSSLTGNKSRPYVIIVVNANGAVTEYPNSINRIFFKLLAF